MPLRNRRPLYSSTDLEPAGDASSGSPAAAGAGSAGAAPAPRAGSPPVAGATAAAPLVHARERAGPQHERGAGASADADDVVGTAEALRQLLPMQPCTVKGLAAALSTGVLGYLLGFVPSIVRHRASKWALIHLDGMRSAQSLALMSGAYTAVHCIFQRLRQTEDGWNRGAAGCATGLALGWGNGPFGAAQSCLGIGALSALLDLGGGGGDAQAGVLYGGSGGGGGCSRSGRRRRRRRGPDGECKDVGSGGSSQAGTTAVAAAAPPPWAELQRHARTLAALPPVAFLGACCRVAYFDSCGSGGEERARGGCGAWPAPTLGAQQRGSGWDAGYSSSNAGGGAAGIRRPGAQ